MFLQIAAIPTRQSNHPEDFDMEELESRADVSADAINGELNLTHIRDTANLDTHTRTHRAGEPPQIRRHDEIITSRVVPPARRINRQGYPKTCSTMRLD